MEEKKRTRIQIRNGRKILEAGEKVFAQYGYHGATLDKVASLADMSQPNLHHYFRTKADLYLAVLDELLSVWLAPLGSLNPEGEPEVELRAYIAKKMEMTRKYPAASRIFAHEMLLGAPMLEPYLKTKVKESVDASARTIRAWIDAGRLRPVDPHHLVFMIWASTQHYADFAPQVLAVTEKSRFTKADHEAAQASICDIILKGVLPRMT